MTYRDDDAALRARVDRLSEQLAGVRAGIARADALRAEETRLSGELRDAEGRLRASRARALPLLETVKVRSPCSMEWDSMVGDERARFCGRCKQTVYDLSAMTRDEAEAFLSEHEGAACVRMFVRADGTVMTRDCSERARRNALRAIAMAAAGGVVAAAAVVAANAEPDAPPNAITAVGEFAATQGIYPEGRHVMGGM